MTFMLDGDMPENAFGPSNSICILGFHVSCEKTLSRLQVIWRFYISCPKTLSGLQTKKIFILCL